MNEDKRSGKRAGGVVHEACESMKLERQCGRICVCVCMRECMCRNDDPATMNDRRGGVGLGVGAAG